MNLINFETPLYYQRLKSLLEVQDREVPFLLNDGFSHKNDYIPLYSAWINRGIYNRKLIHYSIPFHQDSLYNSYRDFRKYSDLYRFLEVSGLPKSFKTSSMEKPMYVMKGLMFELDEEQRPVVHFLVAVKSDHTFSINVENPDLSKFSLFMSTEFISGDKYSNIYKKMKREIIEEHQSRGIDTIITNDINKWCYKNDLEMPSFSTVAEMKEYLKTFNSKIFL